MEKYGFVYLWYDKKHKRFYIGSHWGTEDDGYVCSSSWMKQGYKHRPNDFKRKIIKRVTTNKKDLLEEENRWLGMIKPKELKLRYYNLRIHEFNHWSADKDLSKTVGERISASHKSDPNFGKWNLGRTHSDAVKERLREVNTGKSMTEEAKAKISKYQKSKSVSEVTKNKMSLAAKGKVISEEQKLKISSSLKGRTESEETKRKKSEAFKLRWADPAYKEKMAAARRKKVSV